MCCLPQFGTVGSPPGHSETFGLMGSDAIRSISTWSHFGHSNSRRSKPIGPGEARSSIIGAWQREQRGRSTDVNKCWDDGRTLPCVWREPPSSLSPTIAERDGDGPYSLNSIPAEWSILLTFQDLHASLGLRTRARHRWRVALSCWQNLDMARSK